MVRGMRAPQQRSEPQREGLADKREALRCCTSRHCLLPLMLKGRSPVWIRGDETCMRFALFRERCSDLLSAAMLCCDAQRSLTRAPRFRALDRSSAQCRLSGPTTFERSPSFGRRRAPLALQRSTSSSALARKTMLEVVFCHNDLLGGNVLFSEERGDVVLIDYEYAACNYAAFDIANHFCAVSRVGPAWAASRQHCGGAACVLGSTLAAQRRSAAICYACVDTRVSARR